MIVSSGSFRRLMDSPFKVRLIVLMQPPSTQAPCRIFGQCTLDVLADALENGSPGTADAIVDVLGYFPAEAS